LITTLSRCKRTSYGRPRAHATCLWSLPMRERDNPDHTPNTPSPFLRQFQRSLLSVKSISLSWKYTKAKGDCLASRGNRKRDFNSPPIHLTFPAPLLLTPLPPLAPCWAPSLSLKLLSWKFFSGKFFSWDSLEWCDWLTRDPSLAIAGKVRRVFSTSGRFSIISICCAFFPSRVTVGLLHSRVYWEFNATFVDGVLALLDLLKPSGSVILKSLVVCPKDLQALASCEWRPPQICGILICCLEHYLRILLESNSHLCLACRGCLLVSETLPSLDACCWV